MKNWSDAFVGLPYCDLGRTAEGVDCWGLAYLVYLTVLGINLPSYADGYQTTEERAEISALIGNAKGNLTWRDVRVEPRPFDIAVFRRGNLDSHIGIVVSRSHMLHAVEGDQSKLEDFTQSRWATRMTGIYRHFKMDGRG